MNIVTIRLYGLNRLEKELEHLQGAAEERFTIDLVMGEWLQKWVLNDS